MACALPEEARKEIDRALALNDSGKAYISLNRMCQRLREVYGYRASITALGNHVARHMGRRSWLEA
jgi:hypothetical protein